MKHWIKEANKLEMRLKGSICPVQAGDELRMKIGEGVTKNAALLIVKIFMGIYTARLRFCNYLQAKSRLGYYTLFVKRTKRSIYLDAVL